MKNFTFRVNNLQIFGKQQRR